MRDDLREAFEVLGLEADVTLERLESAWADQRALYTEDGSTVSLLSNGEREAQMAELESAYRRLKAALTAGEVEPAAALVLTPPPDPETSGPRRRKGRGRSGRPKAASAPTPAAPLSSSTPDAAEEASAPEAPPPPRELPPEDLGHPGAWLRACRDRLGLSLKELADRTRINASHLDNIEQERFAKLPPVVYVRGFVQQYARELGVRRPDAVAAAFIERLRAACPEE